MSRKRQGGQLQAIIQPKIQKILECPICLEILFSTNIFTCTNGHIVCGNCKPKLNHCGVCRAQITNTRNLCNEEIIATSSFNCKNHEFGCEVILNGNEMIQQNLQCKFRRFICPLSGRVSPSFSPMSLLLHLKSAHNAKVLDTTAEGFRDIMEYDSDTETTDEDYTEEYGPWPCKLFTWTEANFIIQPEMKQNQMHFRIFSINLPENGGHYFVKIDFRQAGKLKYSVMIEPVPVTCLNDRDTGVTYIQAIIDESVWSKITEVRGESLVLCVYYSVIKL